MPTGSIDRFKLVETALSEVGVHEEGGNNLGPKVREYQGATWLEPGAWAWCAAFVCWCVRKAYQGAGSGPWSLAGKTFEQWRPKTASAVGDFDLEWWARKQGLQVFDEDASVEPGDIITFDFGHCGIAVARAANNSATIETAEANTGPAGLRDSMEGDGVWRKTRARPLIRRIIRLERKAA